MKNVTKVTLAILGPILGLSLIFCAIFLYYRNRRTRRNRSQIPRRSKKLIESRMEPSMLAFSSPISTAGGTMSYSHEFRATAAGDSTLKVIRKLKFINIYYNIKKYTICIFLS
jgi:hypothetical protein